MPEPAPASDLVNRHRRRLMVLLRGLLPAAADAEAAWRETLTRLSAADPRAAGGEFAAWADHVAREVAAGRRKTLVKLPFSDDLFRQLGDSAPRSMDLAEKRPRALAEILNRLPTPEQGLLRRKYTLGLAAEQIALTEGRPPATVSRDLTILHGTLVSALQQALPDGNPDAPGGAGDLGRLVDQLLDGRITEDGRLVLETLLLADTAAQAHYHRHVALAVELEWKYRGEPPMPEVKPVVTGRPALTRCEWAVTVAFVAACLAAAAVIVLVATGQLKR